MHSNRIIYGLLLLALIIMNIYLNNAYALLLLAGTVIIPLLSILLCLAAKNAVSVSLSAPELLEKGQNAEMYAVMRNECWYSAAVASGEIILVNPMTGTQAGHKVKISLLGKGEQSRQLSIEDPEIGRISVTLSDIRIRDLFGLISFSAGKAAPADIIVVPRTVPASVQLVSPLETTGTSVLYSENEPGNDISEVFDTRDYVPGDPVRSIHWNMSAKLDRPILREFSRPMNYSVFLLVELAPAASAALEACACYADSISKGLLNAGAVHTMAFYDRGTDTYFSYNLTDFAEQEDAFLQLLSSGVGEEPDASLQHYQASGAADPNTVLIYLTPSLDSELPLSAAMTVPLCMEYVGTADERSSAYGIPMDYLQPNAEDAMKMPPELTI